MSHDELSEIRTRYENRKSALLAGLYDPVDPYVVMCQQEKLRALARWVRWANLAPLAERRILEIGCGNGTNLLLLLLLGASPDNLIGSELLEERAREARQRLPGTLPVLTGDASLLDLEPESCDAVLQFTVFTSILDPNFQEHLARNIWSLVKPGGGVLWYDFVYNNPANPDVRGVPPRRIQHLFPEGQIKLWRLTLAPPIGRRVVRIYPGLYSFFNFTHLLRTHVLCWIRKKCE